MPNFLPILLTFAGKGIMFFVNAYLAKRQKDKEKIIALKQENANLTETLAITEREKQAAANAPITRSELENRLDGKI